MDGDVFQHRDSYSAIRIQEYWKLDFLEFFKILKYCHFRVNSQFTSLYIVYSRLILSMEMYFDTGIHILQSEFKNIENWIF